MCGILRSVFCKIATLRQLLSVANRRTPIVEDRCPRIGVLYFFWTRLSVAILQNTDLRIPHTHPHSPHT